MTAWKGWENDLSYKVEVKIERAKRSESEPLRGYTVAAGNSNAYLLGQGLDDPAVGDEFMEQINKGDLVPVIFRFLEYRDSADNAHYSWSAFTYSVLTKECHRLPGYDHMD